MNEDEKHLEGWLKPMPPDPYEDINLPPLDEAKYLACQKKIWGIDDMGKKEEVPRFTEVEVDEMLEDGRIKIERGKDLKAPSFYLYIALFTYKKEDWYVAEFIDEDLPSKVRIFKEIIKEILIDGYKKDFKWLNNSSVQ